MSQLLEFVISEFAKLPHLSNGSLVMSQRAIGFGREIQIEPRESGVVGARDDVIASRMNGDRGNPLGRRHQLLSQHLLDEIVNPV